MKTFVKVIGVMMYAAGWALMLLTGVATILTVREHSDAIHEINEKLCDVRNRVSQMENN